MGLEDPGDRLQVTVHVVEGALGDLQRHERLHPEPGGGDVDIRSEAGHHAGLLQPLQAGGGPRPGAPPVARATPTMRAISWTPVRGCSCSACNRATSRVSSGRGSVIGSSGMRGSELCSLHSRCAVTLTVLCRRARRRQGTCAPGTLRCPVTPRTATVREDEGADVTLEQARNDEDRLADLDLDQLKQLVGLVEYDPSADPFPVTGWDALVWVVGNAVQTAHFFQSAFGMDLVAYSGPETGNRDHHSFVLAAGAARFVVQGAYDPTSTLADHHRRHGDGIVDIALSVPDVDRCIAHATAQGATVLEQPHDVSDEHG